MTTAHFGIIRDLTTCFPGAKIAEETIASYEKALEDIDPTRLQKAAKKIAETEKFFPSIAELRTAALAISLSSHAEIDAKLFRQTELALIQLNDERKGGIWTIDQYRMKRAKILEGTGITEEMLENAKVYGMPKSGHVPEPDLTWDQLRWRRRSREGDLMDEGT